MNDKIWRDSHWFFDYAKDAWLLTSPGAYLIAEAPDIMFEIRSNHIEALIRKLDEAGWIKPRLDERLRSEDLKITHRLIDLLDKSMEVKE